MNTEMRSAGDLDLKVACCSKARVVRVETVGGPLDVVGAPGHRHRRFAAEPVVVAAGEAAEVENADFFEAVAKGRDGKQAANWVINELFGRLNKEGLTIDTSPVSADQLGGVIDLIAKGDISGKIAKDLFEIVWTEGGNPSEIVESRGMKQVTDTGAIEAAIDQIIAANPDKVAQAKEKPTLLGWFVGQTMKATGGKANPAAVNALLKAKLGIE